jgi:hypothetical protein
VAWQEIDGRIAGAKQKVLNNEASPLLFFMELRLMDIEYFGRLYRLLEMADKTPPKPDVFKMLSEKDLKKYAEAFNVKVDDFKKYGCA